MDTICRKSIEFTVAPFLFSYKDTPICVVLQCVRCPLVVARPFQEELVQRDLSADWEPPTNKRPFQQRIDVICPVSGCHSSYQLDSQFLL